MEYCINWEIYNPHAGVAGMLLQRHWSLQYWEAEINSLVLADYQCQFFEVLSKSKYEENITVSVVSLISSPIGLMRYT